MSIIGIYGGKVPNSNLRLYEICSDRGNKIWGCPSEEVIGKIVNGTITFDAPHSPQEAAAVKDLWLVMSITEKF